MSLRALTWAMEHPGCPSSSCKLVLLAFANFANEQHWSYPSVETVARLTKLDPKTVRASIDMLERAALLIDTEKRAGRTRQVKVYALAMESHPKPDALPKAPETGTLSDRKAPNFSGKGSQKRVAEPVLGTSTPLAEADASAAPQGAGGGEDVGKGSKGKRRGGARLPDDWTPPPIGELSPAVQAVVRQWPAGAYEFVAAGFIAHWTAESGYRASKLDWRAAWMKWLGAESTRVLSAARNGIDFGRVAKAASPEAGRERSAIEARLEERQASEGPLGKAIRAALRADVGARTYDGWLRPTFIETMTTEAGTDIVVRAASQFFRDWIAEHFTERIRALAAKEMGTVPQVLVKVIET